MIECESAFGCKAAVYAGKMIGSHLSIAGSMVNALKEAEALGFDSVQVFTKNQQQWSAPALKREAIEAWLGELGRLGWRTQNGAAARIVSHASYLANLASPDEALRIRSAGLIRDELARCELLEIPLLVMHPGAWTTSSLEEGIARIAAAVAGLLNEPPVAGSKVRPVLCLENVAGQGSTVGRRFEELAELRRLIVKTGGRGISGRVGFCIDTCHMHAAGYDLSTLAKAEAAIVELDRVCGLENVRCLHVNDSKAECGSRVDRHAHIGAGTIGLGPFAAFMNHAGLRGRPMIMETPKGDDDAGRPWDLVNAERLRSLMAGGQVATPKAIGEGVPRTKPSQKRGKPAVANGTKQTASKDRGKRVGGRAGKAEPRA